MTKTILLTGATDGIGFETAKLLAGQGHTLLIHGRSEAKLVAAATALKALPNAGNIESYRADLSKLSEVKTLADAVIDHHKSLDVIINNAGVFNTPKPITDDNQDVRFIVNTIAPYFLTQRLLTLIPKDGRIINLSSAAQSPVNPNALAGETHLNNDGQAYAQSKLAITMWSAHLAQALGPNGPAVIAVNPGSLLASKMVKDAYGVEGSDLSIGAEVLLRAALSDEFADATGRYFDNDSQRFARPHRDALDPAKNERVVAIIESVIDKLWQE